MTRDACNAQEFVQNVGPTIAWRSRRILDWTLIGGILNRRRGGKGEEGLYRIFSCAARDYGKDDPARRSLRFIFISGRRTILLRFLQRRSIRGVSAHIHRARNGRMLQDLDMFGGIFPLASPFFFFFLIATAVPTRARQRREDLWNQDVFSFDAPRVPSDYSDGSIPCPIWYTEVPRYQFPSFLTSLKYTARERCDK